MLSSKGMILHPALWVQLYFQERLDLYVEALSAAHVDGNQDALDLRGMDDDDRDTYKPYEPEE